MSSRYSPTSDDGCTWQGCTGVAALWVVSWIFQAEIAVALGVAQIGVALYVVVALAAVGLLALYRWSRDLIRHRATSKS